MAEPPSKLRRVVRVVLRIVGVLTIALLVFLTVGLVDAWEAIGTAPEGERRSRMEASSQWADGVFENPEPLYNDTWGMITEGLDSSDYASPSEPIPYERVPASRFETPPATGLRITWLGHSTLLIEIDGHRFLTDPVWGPRSSPVTWAGPRRWYPPPLALDDVPALDAVIISHDHYDHLDYPTFVAMRDWDTTFVVPLGVDAHLAYWGIPEDRIVALDWWDRRSFGDLELVMTPSRHASGREVFDQNRTLWAGYALLGTEHRAFFSGDTGLFRGMREIGERLGPFDVTMLEVGAYGQPWPDWHLGPEQALRAHGMLRGELFVPIHWGLFDLAMHGWTAPIERVRTEAERLDIPYVAPRPGQSFEPGAAPEVDPWWPELPYETFADYPIEATNVD
ncbi:MAG: MBL fold metallo-hydrolase [Sandaracinaceae bacterium]